MASKYLRHSSVMAAYSDVPAVSMPRQSPSIMTSSIASLKHSEMSILSMFFFKKSMMHKISLIESAFLLSAWNFKLSLVLNEAKKLIILKMARATS